MKKSLIFVGAFALMLSLTGCGSVNKDSKSLTCSIGDEDGKIIYSFDFDENDDLSSIVATLEYENEEYAKASYEAITADPSEAKKDVKLDGKKLTYTESVESFKAEKTLEKYSRENIKKAVLEDDGFTCE